MIIADADVWIDFWKRPSSKIAVALDGLLEDGQVGLIGVVLAEIQRGFRDERERQRMNAMVEGLPYFEMTRVTWELAGVIAKDLDEKGLSIPITDACVAAVAVDGDHQVFTRDKRHFERVPGLRLYQTEGDPA